ncbi:AraC family transcriptional regulator [Pseudomonas sp. DTU_2021_1001937_2_SI_NGA_ILE_001]|uniref:AraC family transcriptional regulator n=1 Tax=Pseudomonas sp. DTU_2021_1001937_2_SI_NGA_ILE_001 TaxID=3077589 RepID=UPI0028FC1CC8|nr:AraC family transcriptional regulator [Pseudomonas sp. DTU_2021_1001937_2_SI_NGA_ILE_001]WNW10550.1 AraC family transcriptional regulator [Pseudomonas sp. DTU_2021_1001937_2_SI_NGA_ILE_001]
MSSATAHLAAHKPYFWRDAELPFIEARSVGDGRQVCYAPHSHRIFSIGAITSGCNLYRLEKTTTRIQAGTVVLMNPGQVHACNPIDDQPWSYIMLYVDPQWLADIQPDGEGTAFQPLAPSHSQDPVLFSALLALYDTLVDSQVAILHKQCAAVEFFDLMYRQLGGIRPATDKPAPRIERAAEYIDAHFRQTLRLQDICQAASLSPSYLIRAFEQRYHMTPHAYLLNRRIQQAQRQLRDGQLIADVACDTGFADQAHLQREFKKHLAATPGQYRL